MLELHPSAHSIREAYTVVLGRLELARLGVPVDVDEICRAVYVLCAPHIKKARVSSDARDFSQVSRGLVRREFDEQNQHRNSPSPPTGCSGGNFADHAGGI